MRLNKQVELPQYIYRDETYSSLLNSLFLNLDGRGAESMPHLLLQMLHHIGLVAGSVNKFEFAGRHPGEADRGKVTHCVCLVRFPFDSVLPL